MRRLAFSARALIAVALVPVAVLSTAVTAGSADAAVNARAAGTTYYVSPTGSDAAAGTSPSTAWASLSKVSQAALNPGDQVLLARGGSWTGKLALNRSGSSASPIQVGAYGTGSSPRLSGDCVEVNGSYITVSDLTVAGCTFYGFNLYGDYVTLQRNTAMNNVAAVWIQDGSDYDKLFNNRLIDNNRMAPNTPGDNDDYGAFGFAVSGDHSEIAYNIISGNVATSPDYGMDGSAVELYMSNDTSVHNNVSINNLTFTELGHSSTSDTTFANNIVRSSLADSAFLITRGPGEYWGPVYRTVATNNNIRLTGAGSYLSWCGGDCSGGNVLTMTNNLFSTTIG